MRMKNLEYPSNKEMPILCEKFKVNVWNYLAAHQRKPTTHKCATTPWLRTTVIDRTMSHHVYALNEKTKKMEN
jgi:hypothetical protein